MLSFLASLLISNAMLVTAWACLSAVSGKPAVIMYESPTVSTYTHMGENKMKHLTFCRDINI